MMSAQRSIVWKSVIDSVTLVLKILSADIDNFDNQTMLYMISNEINLKFEEINRCLNERIHYFKGVLANLQNTLTTLTENICKTTEAINALGQTWCLAKQHGLEYSNDYKYNVCGRLANSMGHALWSTDRDMRCLMTRKCHELQMLESNRDNLNSMKLTNQKRFNEINCILQICEQIVFKRQEIMPLKDND
ncbi:hypothetical protein GJ496_000875 [Pomphorhynchus laevis]|nr:hypothetical protein GJ496_000875 [Pomphorhynchus laevis]